MDLVIDFIVEIILEGIVELIQNKNISRWIRYPLLIAISIFYIFIFSVLVMILPDAFKENIYIGIVLLCLEIVLLIGVIYIVRKSIVKKDVKEIHF